MPPGAGPVTAVQLFDRLGGDGEQMRIAFLDLLVRVDPVRQESEGEIAAGAGEMVDLQPFDLLQNVGFAGQQASARRRAFEAIAGRLP